MKILLTNDDGIDFLGLKILEETLIESGHEVWVCAPSSPRSATSHCISIHTKVTIKQVGERRYSCSGYPADCILFAMKGAVPVVPDLIISGINNGYNLSTDIIYSGTVAAAREGAIHGVPSIAVSSERTEEAVKKAAYFLNQKIETFINICDEFSFLNINVPTNSNGKDWKIGNLGFLEYYDNVNEMKKEDSLMDNDAHYLLQGSAPPEQRCQTKGTDFSIVREGVISITVLSILPNINKKQTALLQNLS